MSSLDSSDYLNFEAYNANYNTWATQESIYGNIAENTYTQYTGSLDLIFPFDPTNLKLRFLSSSQANEYFYIDEVELVGRAPLALPHRYRNIRSLDSSLGSAA